MFSSERKTPIESVISNERLPNVTRDIKSQETKEDNRDLAALDTKFNYLNMPGRHSRQSAVVGTRAGELKKIMTVMDSPTGYVLHSFEKAIYKVKYMYIIPKSQRAAANKIAKEIFIEYIEKYQKDGVTEENSVNWCKSGLPGVASNKTWIYDDENRSNTWHLQVAVEADNGIHNEKYGCFFPPHIVALHEFMHVEETFKGNSKSTQDQPGREILTTTKPLFC